MDWSKYYPANYTAITAEDVKMIREKKLAPVDKTAVKQDWDDRSDDNHVDIDNDGDEDSSDKFLHKKRKAITKAVEKEEIDPAIARQKAIEAAHVREVVGLDDRAEGVVAVVDVKTGAVVLAGVFHPEVALAEADLAGAQ